MFINILIKINKKSIVYKHAFFNFYYYSLLTSYTIIFRYNFYFNFYFKWINGSLLVNLEHQKQIKNSSKIL